MESDGVGTNINVVWADEMGVVVWADEIGVVSIRVVASPNWVEGTLILVLGSVSVRVVASPNSVGGTLILVLGSDGRDGRYARGRGGRCTRGRRLRGAVRETVV